MTRVAHFEVHTQQFLDEQSNVTQTLPAFCQQAEKLVGFYREMVLTRLFDTKAITLQRTGKLGTFPPIIGQEAISIGVAAAMHADDVMCPSYREHGGQLYRGVRMQDILRYWGGDERGSDFPGARQDLPISVPIASQCLHAAGAAKALQYLKKPNVAVSFNGDGGTSEGDFYEAINLAGAWNLPIVFVVSNNHWAISVAREAQTACETLAQKAFAGGIDAVQIDGNDIIAVHDTALKALDKARAGNGATVIEAMTYRLGDHTTADDAKRYRSKIELEQAWQKEPIARLRNYLIAQGWWNDSKETALQADCQEQVEQAVKEFLQTPAPKATDMLKYLYAELPAAMQDQWDELARQGE